MHPVPVRYALLILVALAFLSCQPPTAPVPEHEIIYVEVPVPAPPVEEPPAVEPPAEEPPAEPESPAWQPEVMHVYILDSEGTIITDYAAVDEADYRWALTAWSYNVELHNRDDLGLPGALLWHLVGGGLR